MQKVRYFLVVACVWVAACSESLNAESSWPYWRGPRMDQTSNDTNLPQTWDSKGGEGSNVTWKQEIGSRSTPVFMNNRLYLITTEHIDDKSKAREKVVCLDGDTGSLIWEYPFNVYLSDVPIERVGWSSVAADPETGNVFVQGVCGYFACLNGVNGNVIWSRSLHEEFGLLSTYGGRTNFPIVHENNVIVNAVIVGWGGNNAKPAHRFLAFDKSNGQPVYFEGTRLLPFDTTYSAPVIAVIDGELQMIFGSGDGGLHGMQPRTGKILWSYMVSKHGLNCSPVVVGNRVYCGHAEENLDVPDMGAVFCVDASKRGDLSKAGQVWRVNGIGLSRAAPIYRNGKLYVFEDTGKVRVLNADTGEQVEELRLKDRAIRATPLVADNKMYFGTFNGMTYVLGIKADGGLAVVHEKRLPRGEEVHGSAIAVNGKIYFPTTNAMYCLGKPDAASSIAAPEAAPPAEPSREQDTKPALVQVAPVESLLKPGFQQGLQVRLFNAKGQYLRIAKPDECQFSIDGPGEISAEGRYSIPANFKDHAPVYVTVKHGELTGKARIRVVPELDWSFDFNDGQIPVTWVGCSYRHVPLEWDLLTKLKGQDPRAADLYIYIQTGFTNTGLSIQTYDDSTPAESWSKLLEFLHLRNSEEKPKTREAAEQALGASLKLLQDEKILAKYEFTTWDRKTGNGDETVPEPKLVVNKGDRSFSGNGVMTKITTIPLGTRSQGWMGHTDLSNYTIQADILAFQRDNQPPDVALTAQAYTMVLMGRVNQLQIRTWLAEPERFSVTVPFAWEPDTWYTMKFQAAVEGEAGQGQKAVLKGKIWKRAEAEPSEWNIQGEDLLPNVQGSPGFYGDTKSSEAFYDNITVTSNVAAP